jgi:hypothetical protein
MAATNNNRQPIFLRVYNTAISPSSSPTLRLGQVSIQQRNANLDKPFADKLSGMGRGGYQHPATFGQVGNWANSGVPTTRALANATPCETTLGGLVRFTPTYVADTDYPIFGFQVPAGYQYVCTGVAYQSPRYFSGTAAATGSVLQFGIGINSSAASLATADGAGTWAPRRIPLGLSQLAATPTVVMVPSDPNGNFYEFRAPLVVEGGRYWHFIARALLARTAGASEVFHMAVTPIGYFE